MNFCRAPLSPPRIHNALELNDQTESTTQYTLSNSDENFVISIEEIKSVFGKFVVRLKALIFGDVAESWKICKLFQFLKISVNSLWVKRCSQWRHLRYTRLKIEIGFPINFPNFSLAFHLNGASDLNGVFS